MEADWLKETGRLLLTGYVYSGWMVRKAILALVEQDEEGHYFLSKETAPAFLARYSVRRPVALASSGISDTPGKGVPGQGPLPLSPLNTGNCR